MPRHLCFIVVAFHEVLEVYQQSYLLLKNWIVLTKRLSFMNLLVIETFVDVIEGVVIRMKGYL
jgi:hypothetical protein